ncbi:MAG: hypothetical protein JWO80_559 [Bryobacterales bacterium]|nr:hypothetical protein [Bryobacterales bacterium]
MRPFVLVLLFPTLLSGNTLIIGVLGGWQHADEPGRGVRKLALHLRDRHIPNVAVETFANHHLSPAMTLIQTWWSRESNESPALILYGQSFGGAAVAKLAHQLQAVHIPVALTVQIDTVGRRSLIPSNVTAAVNFFQREGWPLRGEALIRAEDPKHTEIIGNYEYHYRDKKVDLSSENWARRMVFGTHLKMEDDPELWSAVEQVIVGRLSR